MLRETKLPLFRGGCETPLRHTRRLPMQMAARVLDAALALMTITTRPQCYIPTNHISSLPPNYTET
jgi:hypothetical protein